MSGGDGNCDNPEEQGSDATWAVALQRREHSPTQGLREGCPELGGKSGEEHSRHRQHLESHGVREGSSHSST